MTYKLRPYQQDCHDKIISSIKKSTDPILCEAFTASGKSLIIAEVAKTITKISGGKKVLVLQPSAELLEQNAEKYRMTGEPCSLFSASVGEKSLRNNVVFGTPKSVSNKLSRFCSKFACLIMDEAHLSLTPTIIGIIDDLKSKNPNLRVIGLTSSPYKLGSGYIYKEDLKGRMLSQEKAKNPYFKKLVAQVTGRYLLSEGYISPVVIGDTGSEKYDTSELVLNSMGKFTAQSIDKAFIGQGRKTAYIINDVVNKSKDRRSVMIFASTVRHAKECLESLPHGLSAMITGETKKEERKKIIRDFKSLRIKYLVSVETLTTGFDCVTVDLIAVLRATESSALFHQIIGRSVRLAEGKTDAILLDYAGNIETHFPDGDIFAPDIRAYGEKKESADIEASCPVCSTVNVFSARKNDEGFQVDENGYFIDLGGMRIQTEFGFMPAHYGRRCLGGEPQCTYRWTHKKCPVCNAENDIAARYCCECKAELVDPGEKLKADFISHKKDPTQIQVDEIVSYQTYETLSRSGNEVLRADIVTPYRSFSVWAMKAPKTARQQKDLRLLTDLDEPPFSVTYKKDAETQFYRILGFNEQIEEFAE